MSQLFVDSLTQSFNSFFFETCARLHDAGSDIDDEELEERAYEITSLHFYYLALDDLVKMNVETGRSGWK